MEADKEQQASDAKVDVKSQVARTLIDAMERGDTPWQKPWKSRALMPTNPTTNNAYRGINRLLLGLAGAGRSSNLWMTYKQAEAQGWQVKRGEKGTMIVKVVEFVRDGKGQDGMADSAGAASEGREAESEQRKAFALKRYWVFNAEQIEGMPQAEQEADLDFDPVEKAEAVVRALTEQTGLLVIHGGDKACYVPRWPG